MSEYEQRELLIKLIMELHGCTYEEVWTDVQRIPAVELWEEILWYDEMLDK